MRASIIISAFLAAAVSATPVAQNGRRAEDWTKPNADGSSGNAPAASSAAPKPKLLGNPSAAPNKAPNAKLTADLLTAATATDRMVILKDAVGNGTTDFKFDFNPAANPGVTPGLGGQVNVANRKNFPLLTDLGASFGALFFAPCGLNTPHTHPRATELFTLVTDGNISTGFIFENTFTFNIATNITQYQGTAFPMGSIHWQLNTGCEPQVAIAGFSGEDPGASSIANRFFSNVPENIVNAALGFPSQITSDNFAQFKSQIPTPFANGIKDCYAKCGIKA